VVALPVRVDWRRNLAALWLAEFTAILGFSFAFPFLPLFLHRELHVPSGSQLAFWTGISASVTGLSLAATSPLWGALADRYGRKPMLIRAMVGGGIAVGLMGLSQNVLQLTGLRFLQGAASGTVAAATALVASETPTPNMAWSLGVVSSAIALGGAVGPALGGAASEVFGLRVVFIVGGILLVLATVPVLMVVRESRGRLRQRRDARVLDVLRAARPGTVASLAVLVVAELLLQSSYTSAQQLVGLRVLQLSPLNAPTLTGIAFGAAGVVTAFAGVTYSRAVRLSGYRLLTTTAALVLAIAVAGAALSPSIVPLIASFVAGSLMYGALIPALTSMVGLETPASVQATVYGVSSGAVALGFGFGPLTGGLIASSSVGVMGGLVVSASVALALTLLLGLRAREPVPVRPILPVR